MQIKLLVACREAQPALALCTQVVLEEGGDISGEGTDIESLLLRASVTKPDVLLLEHRPDQEESTWRVLARLARVSGSTRVLLLCDSYDHLMVIDCIQRGASGCLLRSCAPPLCARAVRAVRQGDTWFGRTELLDALRSQILAEPLAPPGWVADQLTAREQEILALIGSALTNKEIAQRLKISDKTVKTHLHHIYVKLNRSGRFKALLSPAVGLSPWPRVDFAGAGSRSGDGQHDLRRATIDAFPGSARAFVTVLPVASSPASASSEKD